MIDNPSNPPNPSGNRIWKDPSFWKGFLLDMGKGKGGSIMSQYVLFQKISESDSGGPCP